MTNLKKQTQDHSSLYTEFVKNAIETPSPAIQQNFMKVMEETAKFVKGLCEEEDLILDVDYKGKQYWENNGKKYRSCFVDGGVNSSFMSSAAPLAIRAKSYIVKPDEIKKTREKFEETFTYVGDFYDENNSLYDLSDDQYEDNQLLTKKKDAARIAIEMAAITYHVLQKQKLEYCFLHGPLQTPIMPFSGPEFPSLKRDVVQLIAPFINLKNSTAPEDRHFINVYFEMIKFIQKANFPIYGIVESKQSTIYLRNLLYRAKSKGLITETDQKKILKQIARYKIKDGTLFELILSDKQALRPLEVEKQIPSKAWGIWQHHMNKFPKVFVGYLRTNKNQSPIRIESLRSPQNLKKDYEYILATSRLLPDYGFPVGLDVIDKAAKIPAWLGRTARMQYLTYYLNLAIKSKKPNAIIASLKSLSNSGRGWKNRPKAGRYQ